MYTSTLRRSFVRLLSAVGVELVYLVLWATYNDFFVLHHETKTAWAVIGVLIGINLVVNLIGWLHDRDAAKAASARTPRTGWVVCIPFDAVYATVTEEEIKPEETQVDPT